MSSSHWVGVLSRQERRQMGKLNYMPIKSELKMSETVGEMLIHQAFSVEKKERIRSNGKKINLVKIKIIWSCRWDSISTFSRLTSFPKHRPLPTVLIVIVKSVVIVISFIPASFVVQIRINWNGKKCVEGKIYESDLSNWIRILRDFT